MALNLKKWTIKKGRHYSFSNIFSRLHFWRGTSPGSVKPLWVPFSIDASCYYQYKNTDDLDINKLFGFSFGKHHENSIRIGWKPNFRMTNHFDLVFYLYNDGKRITESFATIHKAGVEYTIKIECIKSLNFVSFELISPSGLSITKKTVPFKFPDKKWGYFLWFYFGGNKPAGKTMFVKLRS